MESDGQVVDVGGYEQVWGIARSLAALHLKRGNIIVAYDVAGVGSSNSASHHHRLARHVATLLSRRSSASRIICDHRHRWRHRACRVARHRSSRAGCTGGIVTLIAVWPSLVCHRVSSLASSRHPRISLIARDRAPSSSAYVALMFVSSRSSSRSHRARCFIIARAASYRSALAAATHRHDSLIAASQLFRSPNRSFLRSALCWRRHRHHRGAPSSSARNASLHRGIVGGVIVQQSSAAAALGSWRSLGAAYRRIFILASAVLVSARL